MTINSNLTIRIATALPLVCVCLAFLYAGPPFSFVLGAVVAGGVCWEWLWLARLSRFSRLHKKIYLLSGFAYLTLSFWETFQDLATPSGCQLLLGLLLCVWATDTAAFVGGRFFQGPKLAPSISPNKTWSGFLCGMMMGSLVGVSLLGLFLPSSIMFGHVVVLVLVAQLGDLLESQTKRWANVKDSSALIPGHGGLLDRLDSFIAVTCCLTLLRFFHL